jgi:hypothetical protein
MREEIIEVGLRKIKIVLTKFLFNRCCYIKGAFAKWQKLLQLMLEVRL